MIKSLTVAIYSLSFLVCFGQVVHQSEDMMIEKIANNVYKHTSYLETESWGKVECNGMVVMHETQAIIFDTPVSDIATNILIDWVSGEMSCTIIGVVPTHFHEDCIAGLQEFHAREIPSYASIRTIELAKEKGLEVPQNGFEDRISLFIDGEEVILAYHGAGHTNDNIIGYYPAAEAMFGGCLVKANKASKGFLGDADTLQWSNTVEVILEKYPYVKHIVPGHGAHGGKELLEYTIQLFRDEQ